MAGRSWPAARRLHPRAFITITFIESEVRCVGAGSAARPLVPGLLGVRTEGPLHLDAFGSVVARVLRRDDLLRRDAPFHPMLERRHDVMLRVVARGQRVGNPAVGQELA